MKELQEPLVCENPTRRHMVAVEDYVTMTI